MATVLVTGSTDGIGRETARMLADGGHRVVLHARNAERAEVARTGFADDVDVVTGELTSLDSTRRLAEQAAAVGPFDVIVHNAGIGGGAKDREVTEDGFERIFQVNVLAPYLLTALLPPPQRLVYLTSGLQSQGRPHLDDLQFERRPWDGMQAYSNSKMWDVVLAFAIARLWPDVLSNAVDPGWIRTRMGGPNAPGELREGADTQVWLATSDEPAATVTARYFKNRQDLRANPAAYDDATQDAFLDACAELTGVRVPPSGSGA